MKACIEVFAPADRAAEYSVRVITEPEPTADEMQKAVTDGQEALAAELQRRMDMSVKYAAWSLPFRGKRVAFYFTATGQAPAKER